ncbi:MAG: hypothetical protein ABI267_02495 [Ginsengibacter sp.]
MKKIVLQNLIVALFLFAVQLVATFIFLFWIFHIATIVDVILLSAITTSAFMICMALYQFVYIKSHKVSLNDFNIQARQEATFNVDKTVGETLNTLENIIPGKINSYKFKFNKKLDYYKSKTGASINSWGEIIIVKLTKLSESKTQLYILSEPVYKTTLIDFGKSSTNIEKIKSAFYK